MRARSRGSRLIDVGHRGRRVAQDRREHRDGRVALERPLAGRHLVQHDAEREDVRARDRAASPRPAPATCTRPCRRSGLRRQRLRRERRRRRGLDARLVLAELGETEVEHLDAAVGRHHHVGRLQIAMRDAAIVRGGHGIGERNRDLQQPIDAAARLCGISSASVRALDQLHREERDVAGLLDGVDRDDVRVIERGDGLRFALEALPPLGVGPVGTPWRRTLRATRRPSFVSSAR